MLTVVIELPIYYGSAIRASVLKKRWYSHERPHIQADIAECTVTDEDFIHFLELYKKGHLFIDKM